MPEITLEPISLPKELVKNEPEEDEMTAQRVVLLPDIHHPYQDQDAFDAILKFIEWFKPHKIVLLGDAMNMDAVNHWLEESGQRKKQENKRIKEEYDAFALDILTRIELVAGKKCELIYEFGNHEDWAYQLVVKDPKLEGLVEPEICLDLEKRGWKWIPYLTEDKNGNVSVGQLILGKLLIIHGLYTNKYHAAKMADTHSRSVVYGHTHDLQSYTKVHIDDPRSYHTCQSIGCLCQKAPDYLKGKANRWVTSFGVVYVRRNGDYNLYVPVIIRGKFTFAGKDFQP
jgi:predicted phosphodiesterase